jgi:hypothetical protein
MDTTICCASQGKDFLEDITNLAPLPSRRVSFAYVLHVLLLSKMEPDARSLLRYL